jgi:hypothetical protein
LPQKNYSKDAHAEVIIAMYNSLVNDLAYLAAQLGVCTSQMESIHAVMQETHP